MNSKKLYTSPSANYISPKSRSSGVDHIYSNLSSVNGKPRVRKTDHTD